MEFRNIFTFFKLLCHIHLASAQTLDFNEHCPDKETGEWCGDQCYAAFEPCVRKCHPDNQCKYECAVTANDCYHNCPCYGTDGNMDCYYGCSLTCQAPICACAV